MSTYTTTDAFAEKFITLVKTAYPNLPIVRADQNVTQPVNILDGESLMVIKIEKVTKTGTDYAVGQTPEAESNYVYAGDREVQVLIELFDPQALDNMNQLRDMWELPELQEVQLNLGFMEKRQSVPPKDSTRKQSKEKFVSSARYVTQFHMGIFYTVGSGAGLYLGEIETANITNNTVR
jgi:hypothetical protein